MAKTLFFGALILGLLSIGAYEAWKAPDFDESVREALRELGHNRTYAMRVQTSSFMDDRTLLIDGVYRIDAPQDAYASESTTTLTVLETGETHTFSLRNVSVKDMVYVSVASESALLSHTLPLTDGWRAFSSTDIPPEYDGIALRGTILDNALLFADDGTHLHYVDRTAEGAYVFRLRDPRANIGGSLQTLFERIGAEGRVTVWIKDAEVSQFVFSGTNYVSTTTLLREPLTPITPPL